jgi:uncharacterized phage protein (TIGR01671 family)
MNNKNKYRFWCNAARDFVINYNYNGAVDELFDDDSILKPQQCIGILDSEMKEIYEGDVVSFDTIRFKDMLGVIRYSNDYCSFVIDHDEGISLIWKTNLDSLKIVGNIMKDYLWNEEGKLVKNENTDT